MENLPLTEGPRTAAPIELRKEVSFGVNEVRLNALEWLTTLAIITAFILLTPRVWPWVERFDTRPDFRIPYQLSKDYWLYGRRLSQVAKPGKIIVLGDSVVWGEYVLPTGTLSHFLNENAGQTGRFVNGGLNGLFPLAEEGLITYYSRSLQAQKVILHCNVLWMTSPKADLSTDKEEQFNHSRLVPQFHPWIPCYRADANERLSAAIERKVSFISWVGHLQNAYFGQKSIPAWTLEDDGATPPAYPNAWKNPLAQINFTVPTASSPDPQRGPNSPRHKPWFSDSQGTTAFDWVELDHSLQWRAFQRVIAKLKQRRNDVLVVLGPFNEHLMDKENRATYQQLRTGIAGWLRDNHVPTVIPEVLPSVLYADASHPLTAGYELLAKRIYQEKTFRDWLNPNDRKIKAER